MSSAAAYGTTTSAVPQGAPSAIVRLDLKSGALTDWFTREATQSSVAGFDADGTLIINVNFLNGSGSEIWIATGATSATAIAGHNYYGFRGNGTAIADSHGIWFTG